MSDKVISLGGASGFWGDTPEGARQLIKSGEVDYLVMDYLAEITMSLLARAKAKSPDAGYPPDFITQVIQPYAKEIAERKIKIVANAGGVNPLACRDAVAKELAAQGVNLKVAAVVGDDVFPLIDSLREEGVKELQSGAPLPKTVVSANAYIGAFPIAAALDAGADIVVTGRSADSALALGPLIHEFGWKPTDFDKLAAGSMAGHIIECGPQATGGIFTDWREVAAGWADIGFPIANCLADGSFTIGKPRGTGGLISIRTVAEQITYETGDPANYILPDVVCDLTQVQLKQVGPERVQVSNVRGKAPTPTYKVSATYPDGFRSIATLMVNGIDAAEKAQAMGEAILKRTRNIFAREGLGDYADTSIEILGAEATYGPHARVGKVREVILKVGVRHTDKRAVDIFTREIAPAATGMGQGISGFAGGRPSVQPVLRLYSFLLDKSRVPIEIDLDGKRTPVKVLTEGQAVPQRGVEPPIAVGPAEADTVTVPLVAIAHGRSGDKGDMSNISVLARHPDFLPEIARQLTADAVAKYMAHVVAGPVERYAWPGLHGFNFLLQHSLGGGGVGSLRYDPQGKAHAQMLMDFPIQVPRRWVVEGRVKAA
ncbi:MAG TPA: acyclic terpene utilization AtuA family protein [Alphaproteobacteria bacterium]|nr:acyclic terpene utilization AtuA family protein [Alphaproteobacteria bacterium]